MKKLFVLLVLTVFICVSFPAAALDIVVGGKAGLAHSGYMGEDHRNELDTTSYNNALLLRGIFGAFVSLGLGEYLQIQPELLIVGSGGRGGLETDPADNYWSENFSYLSIPVLIKGIFSFINGDLFVFGGPAVQILLGDGSEALTIYSFGVEDPGSPYPLDLAPLNFSAMAGAGYCLNLLGGEVSFELRYIQGLTRSYDQDLLVDDHRTWSIALIGGYGYRIK
jgi:hypothetical protein